MFGCCSWAVMRISRRNRSAPTAVAMSGSSTLIATCALVAAVPRQVHVRHAAAAQLPLDDVAVAESLLDVVEEIGHAGR